MKIRGWKSDLTREEARELKHWSDLNYKRITNKRKLKRKNKHTP